MSVCEKKNIKRYFFLCLYSLAFQQQKEKKVCGKKEEEEETLVCVCVKNQA
jgi:hypothetical protein